MVYQINSARLFLTYPQCPIPKEDAWSILVLIFPDIMEYIIASERHANGDLHLHIYLKLNDTFRSRDSRFADLFYENVLYHGNYQGCRSEKNVIKYCTKEEDYLSNFDINDRLFKQQRHKRILGDGLISKKITLVDCVKEHPEMIFGYKKLKQDLEEYFLDEQDKRGPLPTFLPNPWGKMLSSTIQGKRRHLWIFSRAPNKGKTYLFAKPLFKAYRSCLQCGDFTYWNINGQEELVIIDEYNNAKLKYSELNSICDGTFGYRVFMHGVRLLNDPLICILSNQSISDLYPFMNTLLYERFNEIEIL